MNNPFESRQSVRIVYEIFTGLHFLPPNFHIFFVGTSIAEFPLKFAVSTAAALMLPGIWFQFKINVWLQIFDGVFTYHALSQGIPEANPLVSNTIADWGVLCGILYWKLFACALLALIVALSPFGKTLVVRALTLTASVYGCLFVVSLSFLLTSP